MLSEKYERKINDCAAPEHVFPGKFQTDTRMPAKLISDPLAHPRVTRIPLDPEQSEILREMGDTFVVIRPTTGPCHRGGMTLLCLPVDISTAKAAESVALGTHRAVKIQTPKQ